MKNLILLSLLLCSFPFIACSQAPSLWSDQTKAYTFLERDSIYKKGITLIFINEDSTFSSTMKKRLIQTFFTVYLLEVKKFNPNAAKKVSFVIDPNYKGVAATGNNVCRFNPDWFKKHPEDIDVVTHETMHIVQDYHSGNIPGWLTEGIADFVRYLYGVNNKAANWALPKYNKKQSYTDSYRIAARFLLWIKENKRGDIVKRLDKSLRDGKYEKNLWEKLTQRSLNQLWNEYGENPEIQLHYR